MSNEQRHRTECIKRGFATPLSATVIEVGDALWHDGTSVYPAGSISYLSSPTTFALCQAYFAARSLGVSLDASPAGKTDPVQFGYDGEWEFPCAALGTALKQGALFGPADDGATLDALYDQIVIEVHDPRTASFVLTRDAAQGATSVWVRPLSGTERGALLEQVQEESFGVVDLTATNALVTDYNFGKRVRILEVECIVSTVLACDTTTPVVALYKDATELDDVVDAFAEADALGVVHHKAIDDASGDDVFGAEDDFDIKVKTAAADSSSAAGACLVKVRYCVLGHTK